MCQFGNGYMIKPSMHYDTTARFLVDITRMLASTIPQSLLLPLCTYAQFDVLCSKSKTTTVGELWGRMLCCIRGVSAAKATALMKRYPTCQALLQAYRTTPERDRPLMLAAVPMRNGAARVGEAVSTNVYRFMYGLDPPDQQPAAAAAGAAGAH